MRFTTQIRAKNYRSWPSVTEYKRCLVRQYGHYLPEMDREIREFMKLRYSWF